MKNYNAYILVYERKQQTEIAPEKPAAPGELEPVVESESVAESESVTESEPEVAKVEDGIFISHHSHFEEIPPGKVEIKSSSSADNFLEKLNASVREHEKQNKSKLVNVPAPVPTK
jgi:hypothetical protein